MGKEGKIKAENIKDFIGELKRCESENKIELLRGLFCAAVADSSLAKAIVEENGVKTIAMLAAESMDNEVKRLGTGLVCLLGLTGCECPSESSMALLVESLCVIAETGPEKASKAARTQLLTLVAQNKAASEAFAGSSLFRKLGAVVEGEKCIRLAEEKVKEEDRYWAVDIALHLLSLNLGGVAMNNIITTARRIERQIESRQNAGKDRESAVMVAKCASLVAMARMLQKDEDESKAVIANSQRHTPKGELQPPEYHVPKLTPRPLEVRAQRDVPTPSAIPAPMSEEGMNRKEEAGRKMFSGARMLQREGEKYTSSELYTKIPDTAPKEKVRERILPKENRSTHSDSVTFPQRTTAPKSRDYRNNREISLESQDIDLMVVS
ncbi:uncharacterized protein MONOS_2124 [Monocercomonoides exilis]|uniref:uncharacterized protein n=1 Tax=Monocercomonoides exilis TaxID=2049356 RepID=UPI003559EDA7|nr:hypothetical protein MONOS_2124 [Monocercomonoides exilis]|eukprot:MONOS_2124.1-p1 / transcript=MONOS_2124.1 / gene=MONOS_2124 / organism=Monocercomonoides_exilis_PA203 / gene_product=unspecified product / transcript_product=unspecified product / location=Mono_scaffold00041:181094-182563(+) / protein_length=381 / sequence_SO=supercontig / SO=protein_coding / is_pseudo=false